MSCVRQELFQQLLVELLAPACPNVTGNCDRHVPFLSVGRRFGLTMQDGVPAVSLGNLEDFSRKTRQKEPDGICQRGPPR